MDTEPLLTDIEQPKVSRKRVLIIIGMVVAVLALGGAGSWWFFLRNSETGDNKYSLGKELSGTPGDNPLASKSTQQPGTVRLVATGDMIAHGAILERGKKSDGGYDFSPMMSNMEPFFEKADVRFCNQATPAGGEQFGLSGYPVFNAPVEFARAIEGVGCNVINLGTNHTNDKGQALVDATVAAWDNRQGVYAVVGANRTAQEQQEVRYFTTKGIKFAALSYSTYTNNRNLTPHGVNMYNDALVQSQMAEARKQADIVLVSMRWGTEYSPNINPQQETIAQNLANLGADAVFGHGPHVLQPVKRLKGSEGRETIVWYSLGNFLNAQIPIETLIGGFAVMDIDPSSKKIAKVSFMPVYMHYEWTADEKKREDLLKRQNFSMFPLDQAAEPLTKSQNGTTVEAQTDRVKKLLNSFIEVPIISSKDY